MNVLRLPLIAITTAVALSACGDNLDRADAGNSEAVALGEKLYAENCAECHGADLKGQPNWRETKADGTLPAPPHDDSGHTWHHDDQLLFKYTKLGGAGVAPPNFKSAMPGFGANLSDHEIWAVLSYIKSRWSLQAQARQAGLNK
ncbi:c-type cytochrome [Magnetovibrio sp.]|uniref:c-type cytochrome n=1 Tax=Magnetovibrio sp. TaxID=2024836 RepID=UPI002F949E43